MRWFTVIVIVLVVVTSYLFWKNMRMPRTTGLVNGKLHHCPKSPNCVCCCHDGTGHYLTSSLFFRENFGQDQEFLSTHYNAEVVQRTPDYMHVVVTTPTMHFKDDLEFSVNKEKGVVLVRSASRVGYGDGGVNRARIEAIRTYLEKKN